MPAIIEMRLRPDKPFEPTTLHLHPSLSNWCETREM